MDLFTQEIIWGSLVAATAVIIIFGGLIMEFYSDPSIKIKTVRDSGSLDKSTDQFLNKTSSDSEERK